jgi:hypothetical protein
MLSLQLGEEYCVPNRQWRQLRGTYHPPSSGLKSKACKQAGRVKLSLLASMTSSSGLKMEALCSSEPSINFYETTRHHIPESTIHGHSCKNLLFVGFKRSTGLQSRRGGVPPYSRGNASKPVLSKMLFASTDKSHTDSLAQAVTLLSCSCRIPVETQNILIGLLCASPQPLHAN